jgi:hypothetical protein
MDIKRDAGPGLLAGIGHWRYEVSGNIQAIRIPIGFQQPACLADEDVVGLAVEVNHDHVTDRHSDHRSPALHSYARGITV